MFHGIESSKGPRILLLVDTLENWWIAVAGVTKYCSGRCSHRKYRVVQKLTVFVECLNFVKY